MSRKVTGTYYPCVPTSRYLNKIRDLIASEKGQEAVGQVTKNFSRNLVSGKCHLRSWTIEFASEVPRLQCTALCLHIRLSNDFAAAGT